MKKFIKNFVKNLFDLYEYDDFQIGGHCGCCGSYIKDEIFPKMWAWGLCKKCIKNGEKEKENE